MELIAKTSGDGKTKEAIEIAKSLSGKTLYVSTEDRATNIIDRINDGTKPIDKIIVANLQSPAGVLTMILGYAAQDIHFDNIVLDVNLGISRADWFKFALGLEEDGYTVVVTQRLTRTQLIDRS